MVLFQLIIHPSQQTLFKFFVTQAPPGPAQGAPFAFSDFSQATLFQLGLELLPPRRRVGQSACSQETVHADPRWAMHFYAEKTWEQLRAQKLRGNQRLGLASLRGLVELASAVADG
jgi:hypothetical protein